MEWFYVHSLLLELCERVENEKQSDLNVEFLQHGTMCHSCHANSCV